MLIALWHGPVDDALDQAVLSQAIEEGYVERSDQRLIATTEGCLRLDALLAALVK